MGFERNWHRHYDSGVPGEIPIEQITLPECLTRTAQRFPERTALNFLGRRITYRELEALVNRVARALMAIGVQRGDKVAMLLPNMPQLVAANYAAMRIGAVPALFDPLARDEDLIRQVKAAGATVLFTLDLLFPRALDLREAAAIRAVVVCHISDFLPFPGNKLLPIFKGKLYCSIPRGPDTDEFLPLAHRHSDAALENAARWEEPGVLLHTGGTGGEGRGVLLSHANLSAGVQQLRAWLPELKDGAEAMLAAFPFFHPFGWTVMQNLPIFAGWADILVPRSELATIIDLTKRYRPTLLPGSPAIFRSLLTSAAFRKLDITCLKAFLVAGAPLPDRMVRGLKAQRDIPVINLYGLTEASAAAAATPWGAPGRPGSGAVPLPNTDLKVVDPLTGARELPAGEKGEICLKGPQVLPAGEETPAAGAPPRGDGWFPSGDIGLIDADGWLHVTDRKEERIAAGELDFYPSEVEAVLLSHPKVLEACAVDVPDGAGGVIVKACLVLKPFEEGDKREVIAYCQERLDPRKAPRIVQFLTELPQNADGRILRSELRKEADGPPAAEK
jgi:long-chain acyl-CoA synthetase